MFKTALNSKKKVQDPLYVTGFEKTEHLAQKINKSVFVLARLLYLR